MEVDSQQHATSTPTSLAPPIHPSIHVTNIVCGINLDCRLDHRHIANSGRFSNIGPARGNKGARFPAAVLRIKDPKSTALVFDSGKMQVLGTRSLADAKLAVRKFARILQKMGYDPRLDFRLAEGGFRVQNVVASVDTGMVIRLEGLEREHRGFACYVPEIFPGLTYKVVEPRVTFLVFAKGKVVLVGARSVEDVERAWERMWPVLLRYRRV